MWPVGTAAVAVVGPDGVRATTGDQEVSLAWASVTKIVTALATWIAVEEGTITLDDAAGPPGSTVRHLLAHASGIGFDSDAVLARPGTRRIYSNRGIEVLAETVGRAAGIAFADYAREGVLGPLGMDRTLIDGSPAADGVGPVSDLARLGQELLAPTLIAASTLASMTAIAFPGLNGVLPGFGPQRPNDWAHGVELRDGKSPHWTPTSASARTFGHFGRSGGFLWVDPVARIACACLTDRDFGPWSRRAWPPFGDDVLREAGGPA